MQRLAGWVRTIARNCAKARNGLGSWYLVLPPQEGASRPVPYRDRLFWLLVTDAQRQVPASVSASRTRSERAPA